MLETKEVFPSGEGSSLGRVEEGAVDEVEEEGDTCFRSVEGGEAKVVEEVGMSVVPREEEGEAECKEGGATVRTSCSDDDTDEGDSGNDESGEDSCWVVRQGSTRGGTGATEEVSYDGDEEGENGVGSEDVEERGEEALGGESAEQNEIDGEEGFEDTWNEIEDSSEVSVEADDITSSWVERGDDVTVEEAAEGVSGREGEMSGITGIGMDRPKDAVEYPSPSPSLVGGETERGTHGNVNVNVPDDDAVETKGAGNGSGYGNLSSLLLTSPDGSKIPSDCGVDEDTPTLTPCPIGELEGDNHMYDNGQNNDRGDGATVGRLEPTLIDALEPLSASVALTNDDQGASFTSEQRKVNVQGLTDLPSDTNFLSTSMRSFAEPVVDAAAVLDISLSRDVISRDDLVHAGIGNFEEPTDGRRRDENALYFIESGVDSDQNGDSSLSDSALVLSPDTNDGSALPPQVDMTDMERKDVC